MDYTCTILPIIGEPAVVPAISNIAKVGGKYYLRPTPFTSKGKQQNYSYVSKRILEPICSRTRVDTRSKITETGVGVKRNKESSPHSRLT